MFSGTTNRPGEEGVSKTNSENCHASLRKKSDTIRLSAKKRPLGDSHLDYARSYQKLSMLWRNSPAPKKVCIEKLWITQPNSAKDLFRDCVDWDE